MNSILSQIHKDIDFKINKRVYVYVYDDPDMDVYIF
jgi:hypothetical protein